MLEGQTTWTDEEASQHLVNETALALRTIVINTHNKVNPLRLWGNAAWFYSWTQEDSSNSHCTLMGFIPVVAQEIPLQRPGRHLWTILSDEMQTTIAVTANMGRLLWLQGQSDSAIKDIVGPELYESECSPLRPLYKCGRPQGPSPDKDLRKDPSLPNQAVT